MKTVFIIGAGASKEVNLPVGSDLKDQIARALLPRSKGGEDELWEALSYLTIRDYPGSITWDKVNSIAAQLRVAMPYAISIDNFLDVHAGDEAIVMCGKLAIVHLILKAEANSLLYVASSTHLKPEFREAVNKTWFNGFMQLLTEGCRKSSLKERLSSISLIIFNYDRCIEHYIYHALQGYYNMEAAEAAELINGMEIYHPYGTVGSLPYFNGNHPIGFGQIPHASSLPALAKEINTFTEGTDETSSSILAIREHVKSADRVVFLGFAFHDINMKLLLGVIPPSERVTAELFATTVGISYSDRRRLVRSLASSFGMRSEQMIHINDMACGDLLKEHRRGLSFVG